MICLCWNCGREIEDLSEIAEINEELWCEECAGGNLDEKEAAE